MTVKFNISGAVVLLLVTLSASFAAEFPAGYTLCPKNDEKCLFERMTATFAKHAAGIPEINLVSLDPLIIPKMDIVQGGGGLINIVLNFKGVNFTGLSQTAIKKASGFTANPTKMELDILTPVTSLIGGYKITGNVLILRLWGDGRSNMTVENLDLRMKWNGKLVNRNDKQYYQMGKMKATFDVTRFHMLFTNLFNGNKALGDNANVFLNENWQLIMRVLKPAIINAYIQVFQPVISNVFNKVPYDELFQ